MGFEPTTCGLRNRCSTPELGWRKGAHRTIAVPTVKWRRLATYVAWKIVLRGRGSSDQRRGEAWHAARSHQRMTSLRRLSSLVPLLAIGCSSGGLVAPGESDGGATIDCKAQPAAMIAFACYGDLDGGGGGTEPVTLAVDGTITSIAEGVSADGCLRDRVPSLAAQASSVHAVHLRAADGTESIVGLVVPNDPLRGLTVGAHLAIDVRHQSGGWGPTEDEITVRFTDGFVYYGSAGTVDGLKSVPRPVALYMGARTCLTHDECGDWAGYELGVFSGGTTAFLTRGVPTRVGHYTIINGGLFEQTGDTTKCADWFVADASVMIVEHSLAD